MAELARALCANYRVPGSSPVHAFLFFIILIIITAIRCSRLTIGVSADIPWISTDSIESMDIYRPAYGILWIPIGEFGRNLCHFRVSGHPVDSTGFLWIPWNPVDSRAWGGGTVKYSCTCVTRRAIVFCPSLIPSSFPSLFLLKNCISV